MAVPSSLPPPPPLTHSLAAPRPPLLGTTGFLWWLPLLAAIAAGFVAFLLSEANDDIFEAEALLLAPADSALPPETYAALATDASILRESIRTLRIPVTVEELRAAIDVTVDGALISLRVRATDPDAAEDLTRQVANRVIAGSSDILAGAPQPSVLRPPSTPTSSINDHTARNTAFAVAAALAGGIALAALVSRRELPPPPPAPIPAGAGVPVLTQIPRELRATTPALIDRVDSPEAHAYRLLQRTLESERDRTGFRTLLVAGLEDGFGASTAALNLALASAESGVSTLLVDADLRRPAVHRLLHLANSRGFADALAGEAAEAQEPHVLSQGTLWVLTSGLLPIEPAHLFRSARAATVLAELAVGADLTILDGPSLQHPETPALAALCDATLLVVEARRLDDTSLATTAAWLDAAGAHVLGAVVTKAAPEDGGRFRAGVDTLQPVSSTGVPATAPLSPLDPAPEPNPPPDPVPDPPPDPVPDPPPDP